MRSIILHADDVGLCHSTVAAFAELSEMGAVSSGSLMVPCPAFSAAAEYCRSRPLVDAGMHLTLTSEWESLRWGPLAAADAASGLVDDEGFFHRTREAVGERADPAMAAAEMRAQLAAALASGVDVTHVDSHMFAALHPRLLPGYLRLAREQGIPALLWRPGAVASRPEVGEAARAEVEVWAAAGLPVADHVASLPLGTLGDRWEQARAAFDALPPGLTHFILHPACDDPELRAVARDWPARVADYELFRSGRPAEYLRRQGIRVIGYRELRGSTRA
ncbi:MAG TPA: polysaccharide deacetylase family protein [Thermoanaerobaculia bacterium]|nr:polysaccharide deacetylase family protein [Thermoanaerobaculia bacterium]